MHVHLPKPLHGWREFFHEVAIIVLGVVIALSFDQMVESIHWSYQVHAAREAIHREMAFDLAVFSDRVRIAPCLERDLAEAQRRLDFIAATGSAPAPDVNADGPGRLILIGDYEAQQAAQNLVHFPSAELSALGLWYDQARTIREWNDREEAAWDELALIAPAGTKFGELDVALLRRDFQVAKNLHYLMVLNARREIARARQLGVSAGPSRLDYVERLCRTVSI